MTSLKAPGRQERSRRAIGSTVAAFILIVVIITSAISIIATQSLSTNNRTGTITTSITTSSSATGSGATFLIRVVNGPNWSPIAGMTVVAGPISSPNDVAITPGGTTITQCVDEVPNGSTVGDNGTVVSNGTTTTPATCTLTDYTTNSSGWVSIYNATGQWYFIKAGNVNEWNYIVLGVLPNNTVNLAIPLPSGNSTVPASVKSCVTVQFSNMTSGCTSGPGTPILWPATTMILRCGEGVPSGSAVTGQYLYGGYYIAYPFVNMPNGTKAALSDDCDTGSL